MKRAIASLILASLLMTTLPLNVAADESEDIPTNVAATGVHDSLVAALTHAGLVETLQGDGPFTVFAPTDAAFAAAGIDLAEYDTPEENATLVDILTYHVYSGAVASSNVTDGLEVTMVNGDAAVFAVDSTGTVTIEGATVTTAMFRPVMESFTSSMQSFCRHSIQYCLTFRQSHNPQVFTIHSSRHSLRPASLKLYKEMDHSPCSLQQMQRLPKQVSIWTLSSPMKKLQFWLTFYSTTFTLVQLHQLMSPTDSPLQWPTEIMQVSPLPPMQSPLKEQQSQQRT